jgi:hypothetical protein
MRQMESEEFASYEDDDEYSDCYEDDVDETNYDPYAGCDTPLGDMYDNGSDVYDW